MPPALPLKPASQPEKVTDFAFLFCALPGKWALERSYSDGSRFTGKAIFGPYEKHALSLSETGTLTRPDKTHLIAGREWNWRLVEPDVLEVHFGMASGGGLYHRIALRAEADNWAGEAEHLCGADRYIGQYMFGADRIIVRQQVSGPNKEYDLETRFLRR